MSNYDKTLHYFQTSVTTSTSNVFELYVGSDYTILQLEVMSTASSTDADYSLVTIRQIK